MAIQIPNPGTGNGATGDNEFVLWSKVKDNFSDQSNAAARGVGVASGNAAVYGSRGLSDFGYGATISRQLTDSEVLSPSSAPLSGFYAIFTPVDGVTDSIWYSTVLQMPYRMTGFPTQLVVSVINGSITVRYKDSASDAYISREVYSKGVKSQIYDITTASGANVAVDNAGRLTRASSSERYKDIISPLELDDEHYADAMSLNPIIYRSKSEVDNPDYHYYSFSAEVLGAYDPAFTLWRETETVTDDEGNTTEQPLDERVAEGLNLNAIVAFLHATNVKQGKLIDELSARIGVLEDANK